MDRRGALLCLLAGGLPLAAGAVAGSIPPAVRKAQLRYDGYLVNMMGATPIASARMRIDVGDATYAVGLEVESVLADLVYESRGKVDAKGFHPEHYIERRKVALRSPRTKEVRLREAATAPPHGVRVGDVLQVPPGTQDRLSMLLQYGVLARAQPAILPQREPVDIPYARFDRVVPSRWRAQVAAPVPIGARDERSLRAWRIARVAEKDDVGVVFWLGADAAHLPLQLEFSDGDRSLRFVKAS